MRNIVLLFTLCSFFKIQAQSDISSDINKLNQYSFEIENVNYTDINISFDDTAKKVLKKGKEATKQLIESIENEDKLIAIHLMLTKIWCSNKLSNIKTQYIYDIEDVDEGEIIKEVYTINKLVFIKDIENNTYQISKSSVGKIKEYWRKLTNI